ncbi:rhodanese-like domain-containing protein [Xylophilus sp. GOD-11R]|uniref:rhodanese-like domain-containing protein n=1 Tax=Xylophilus sp. GOD-11R TaxID=3089814 RepID=UPI00298C08CE|nr:rhodanese-like domain-containing protein [Xylophilus sp. GOD-11R]WPB59208.1 rhodanese-like domain-containing protein [Xylophilus sp. GOD-11R]
MPISPEALRMLLLQDDEIALLDVREARQAFGAHIALARHAPLSSLELQIPAFVPRRDTPVVVYDEGDVPGGPADRAHALLSRVGWTDVRRLRGGLAAWQAESLPTIDGYGALIKSFGDLARRHYRTPTVAHDELAARLADLRPTIVVDVRPADEHAFLTIAGARNYPGTEAALRQWPSPAEPDALWAVHCFSRTRGIIGATTLRLLGAGHVAFVEDGVMAWNLRGSPVERDAAPPDDLPAASPALLRRRADTLVSRYGLQRITPEDLQAFRANATRSLYLFDLRPAGPSALHPAGGARRVAGGQLLMHVETLVGTRGARVVLIDEPHGLRAAVTAFWLTQFNQCEVFVLEGPAPPCDPVEPPPPDDEHALDAAALQALLATGRAHVVDLASSADYESGHIPGAFYLLPASLAPADALIASDRTVVFTSADGASARLAARDTGARWLRGGTTAWKASALPLEAHFQPHQLLSPFDDDFGSVMRHAGPDRAAGWHAYLRWERGVADRIARDPTVRFRFFD